MFIKKVGGGKETERTLKLLVLFDFPSYEIFYHWFSGSGSAEGPATNFHDMSEHIKTLSAALTLSSHHCENPIHANIKRQRKLRKIRVNKIMMITNNELKIKID